MQTPCSKGLKPIPDNPDTSIVEGTAIGHAVNNGVANGDMAPAMDGEVTGVTYKQHPYSYGGTLNRKHAMGMEKKAIGSKFAWHSSFPFSSIMIVLSFAGVTFMCLRIGCTTRRFRTLTRTMDAEDRASYSMSLQGRAPYTMVDIDECELDSVMEPMGSNPKPSEVIGECYAPVCSELNDGYEDLLVPTENIPGTTEEFIPASQRVRAWQNVLGPDEPCSSRQPLLGTDDAAELTDCESRDVSERRVFGI
jgi:hypothetical protein